MNCLDKMYKEIEEILKKEEQEEKSKYVIKQVKYSFSSPFEAKEVEVKEPSLKPTYVNDIDISLESWVKKPFDVEKAKSFAIFIFKKFFVFNSRLVSVNESAFLNDLTNKIQNASDIIEEITNNICILLDSAEEDEKVKEFFLNPYNALFKNEEGYFAVINGNKYSDVKRPFGFNKNQLKKAFKDIFDLYLIDFNGVMPQKEHNAFVNFIKAEINKADITNVELAQQNFENVLKDKVLKYGVKEEDFNLYLKNRGLRLEKQGNFYFYSGEYKTYLEYKNIEFRY